MKSFDIKKILNSIHLPQRHEYKTISSKAHHDWKMMVLSCFVLSAFSIAGNIYFFAKINNGSLFSAEAAAEPVSDVVSKKNLEDTVVFFKNKQARFEDLKTLKPSVVEPSM